MKLLFRYNKDSTFCEDVLVEDISDVMEFVEGNDGITVEQFKVGLTDVRPTGLVVSGISPKFIDGKWLEDTEAVQAHLKLLPKPKQLMTHEQMDELLTYLAGGKI